MRLVFARAVVRILVASVFVLVGATAGATAADASCPTYEFLAARGSGQSPQPPSTDYGSTDQYGMGDELYSVYTDLQNDMPDTTIQPYGVHYPAVPVSPWNDAGAFLHLGFLGPYNGSVSDGHNDAVHRIESTHGSCPATRFILGGYSQGAQAIGDAIQQMPSGDQALVSAVVLFGDPYFNPESWADRSSSGHAFATNYGGLLSVRDEYSESLHGFIFSYCHARDPVCQGSKRFHIWGDGNVYLRDPSYLVDGDYPHTTYKTWGDTTDAAREVADALGYSPAPVPYSGPLDIAFAIDSTGSMGDVIGQVQANVANLVNGIAAVDSNFRVALVDYKDSLDQESAYQSRVDTTFTTDLPTFTSALNSLTAEGGGDTPESVYSGIMTALGLDWRTGAKKLVIQIGDAGAKDPEPETGYTLSDVRNKALSVDPAAVDAVQPGTDPEAESSLGAIAAATGGKYLQLPNRSDLSGLIPAIESDVQESATAPTATLSVPEAEVVGSPVVFSAGASTDPGEPIVAYEWDFNGDGTYDATTTDPVVLHTYESPYNGNAVVRVRAKSGLTALASTTLSVSPPVEQRPATPTALTAEAGDSTATLTWAAATGPPASWFTIYDGVGNVLDRVAANPDGSAPPSWTFAELTDGTTYSFAVGAGNERGESPAEGPVSVTPQAPAGPHVSTGAGGPRPQTPQSHVLGAKAASRIKSRIRVRWLVGKTTKVRSFAIINLPTGATVIITCASQHSERSGCPFRHKQYSVRRAVALLNLTRSFRGRLGPGALLGISITAPDEIGEQERFLIRYKRSPKISRLCLPVGSLVPRSTC